MADDKVPRTFRALVESAEKKFARVRDVPPHGGVPPNNLFAKVFKAYHALWKYQQSNRRKLVESGLQRWEIGEIASRIGQLYFGQYMRTSEVRFLLEAYIFYEAILDRGYFEGSAKDRGIRFKELRFYARFILVSLIFCQPEKLKLLVERFKALVDDSISTFRETNFKEWKLVLQEILRFMRVDQKFISIRTLRYCAALDSYAASAPYVARFHAKKVLKFRDALLTSYHRNEVKFAEFTLDSFRMLQCLEWEPSGSFYKKHPVESVENGAPIDHSATSGLIDMNLVAETDPSLPPNPRKAVLYRPSATQLVAVMATICDELPPESVMLVYISASGNASQTNASSADRSGFVKKSSKVKVVSHTSHQRKSSAPENHVDDDGNSGHISEDSLWFGPSRNGGSNNVYPGDFIPFTRRPLFLIVDSDSSHAFKVFAKAVVGSWRGWNWEEEFYIRLPFSCNEVYVENWRVFAGVEEPRFQVLHGTNRGEAPALLLSPLKPSFKNDDVLQSGSQFTFFLTAPLQAFCQLAGLTSSEVDSDANNMLSTSFSEWEVILCKSTTLDLVWAQVLSDPFLRRLILRYIFCRSVLALFWRSDDSDQYLPVCLPQLPSSLSPNSQVVKSAVFQLASHLGVSNCFHLNDT